MRNIRVVFAVLSLSVVLVAGVADELQAQEKRQGWIKRLRYRRELRRELQGEIQLSGAFALYPMAVKWAEEFRKIHPKVRIDISAGGAGKGITDALAKVVDLGMVSRDIYPQELEKGAFPIAVVKDAVVPTINSNNPLIDQILATGLKNRWLRICGFIPQPGPGAMCWGRAVRYRYMCIPARMLAVLQKLLLPG